ncbi:MAG: hypothetical protein A2X36_03665 [Elusimicrobia bacterium GWA2_69_24]|nr:MAG: hypothetical protein A2X36_03665 [Elusimicrobia bacterium GWA2_69_24]
MNLLTAARRIVGKLAGKVKRRLHAGLDGSPAVPAYFELELAPDCNLRCGHCGQWQRPPDPRALTPARWEGIVDEIAAWAGSCHLALACGEPLTSPALFPIVARAQRAGIAVTLVTNGSLLGAPEARRLREAGTRNIIVSLDGTRAETHDRGRGVPGTHARVLRALEHLAAEGLSPRTQLHTVVAGHNLGELEGLALLARNRGLAGIRFQALRAQGDGWRPLWPEDPAAVDQAVDGLLRLRSGGAPILNPRAQLEAMKGYFRDKARTFPGLSCRSAMTLVVGTGGQVRCCRFMEPIGDARFATLREVWNSPLARARLDEVRGCHASCVLMNCHYPPD